MRQFRVAFALLVGSGVLIGCGGGGDNGFTASPFRGNYQGTFTSSNSADAGTLTMAIDQNGQLRGTLVNNGVNPPATENISGVIQDNGDLTGDLTHGAYDYPMAGNLGFDINGNLSGPVDIRISNLSTVHSVFSLTYVSGVQKFGSRQAPKISPIKPVGKAQIL